MPKIGNLWPYALSLLRLAAGFTFIQHGLQKVFGLFGGFGGRAVPLISQLGGAGLLEIVGGALILAGLFTRPVALILCAEMLFAYITVHAPRGFWPLTNGGELAVLYFFIFLLLAAAGGGPLSLDRVIRKRS